MLPAVAPLLLHPLPESLPSLSEPRCISLEFPHPTHAVGTRMMLPPVGQSQIIHNAP